MRSVEKPERNHELLAYRMAGHSNKECAEVFQLTASRVGQIIRRQSMIEAREMAKKMAKSGVGYKEMVSALCRAYHPVNDWVDKDRAEMLARDALMATRRFNELTLHTGLWASGDVQQLEDSINALLARETVVIKTFVGADIFFDRESGIFAFALNRAFCYPIRKRVLDGHYFCVSELEGRPVYIDVRGITTSWAHFCYTEQATAEGMSSPIDENEVRNEAIQRLGENRFEQLREAATSFIATSWYGTYDVEGFDEKLQKKARMEGESS